jgi:hypothetical protein
MSFQRLLMTQIRRANADQMLWTYPLLVGFGWFIWDTLDEEWLISLNLATDPEAILNRVEKERVERQEAVLKAKQTVLKSPGIVKTKAAVVEDDEPEEEEEEEQKDEDSNDADEDDVPAGEDGDDSEEEEEEEEEEEVVVKPLYVPTKGKKLSVQELWDNFTIKALNMSEDDDDDEEEEDEEGMSISIAPCPNVFITILHFS